MKFIEEYFNLKAFIFLSVLLSFWLFKVSNNASITEDELLHIEHGKEIYKWLKGEPNNAVLSPIDSLGKWTFVNEGVNSKSSINAYGGFFDFFIEFLYQTSGSNTDIYTFKHQITAIVGAIGFITAGLIAFELTGSWMAAIFALLLVFTMPRLFGNAISNPKDIPFLSAYTLSIFFSLKFINKFPRFDFKYAALFIIITAVAIGIRVGAFINLFYFLLFSLLMILFLFYKKQINFKKAFHLLAITYIMAVLAYLCATLFWPWAIQNPIKNPLLAVKLFSNFNTTWSYELFEGKYINEAEKPWYYIFKWSLITLPIGAVIGVILYLIFLIKQKLLNDNKLFLFHSLVVFTFIFPLFYIFVNGSTTYNGVRHFMFIFPVVGSISGIGFYYLHKFLNEKKKTEWIIILFSILLIEPIVYQVKNSISQALYFSPVVGGTKGAFTQYEMDYWGYANRAALEWLEDTLTRLEINDKLNVRMWYGSQCKLEGYTTYHSKKLNAVLANESSTAWDVNLIMIVEAKNNPALYNNWPPSGTIYSQLVDGAPVACLVMNKILYPEGKLTKEALLNKSNASITATFSSNSASENFARGLELYNSGNLINSIKCFNKSIDLGGDTILCLNNISSCFTLLKMYDQAIDAVNKALQKNNELDILKANKNWALDEKKKLVESEGFLIDLSYKFYELEMYPECIEASKKALKFNTKNHIAYNNICSAYNALQKWDLALNACNEALKIKPDFQLAKNNKDWAINSSLK